MKNKITMKILASALVIVSMMAINPVRANAEWKQDNTGWWYTEGNSYATGWRLIDGNWYYFYSDGYMASLEKIDGYFLDSTGKWNENLSPADAFWLTYKEDYKYIKNIQKNSSYELLLQEVYPFKQECLEEWNLPKDKYYILGVLDEFKEARILYFVGKNSKNVYAGASNGNAPIYQIKDGEIVNTYYHSSGDNCNWREFNSRFY